MRSIDRGFDDLFKGLPIGMVQMTDEQRNWSGNTLFFAFNARAGFMVLPIKGSMPVTDHEVIVEIDLPPMITSFIPEERLKVGLERQVRGLLGPA